ncbi:sugar ABC transporter ATP-binding protein [Salisediminibacterium halotolerans]|uniref:Ribose transport system ATP-binding protein n=1 Tax=Salisediminibacterium halotolerans TaxID=517425 RepID=A0A1H9UAG7_9BACI|nr:sugar ABC transporter ATP-binding protein [Salisediminibacterium haloalkalitolerans]SES06154.1 ribose transport system ATP-binding protein [Salisediminibacterium haloalkalitolerans]
MIEMRGIDKSFGANKVLKSVDFHVAPGEIHALMGENGAGKSTLIKILTGIHKSDAGTIRVKEREIEYSHPKEAEGDGIAVIHQELNILPELSVAENFYLGKEETAGRSPWLKTKDMNRKTAEVMGKLGLNVSPTTRAGSLSVGQQQIIEIAKALETNAELIIMDEPTAALTGREIETLFKIIRDLQAEGVSFVYISHRMEEIFSLCDRITVLRDGEYIGTRKTAETDFDGIVKMMVGRDLGDQFPDYQLQPGAEKLAVKELAKKGLFEDVSFSVCEGEIFGIAGLMGAGRSEVVETLFGYRKKDSGAVFLDGEEINLKHPHDSIVKGFGFVSEDRKSKGLVVHFSIQDNLNMTNLNEISKRTWISANKERELYDELVKKLGIVTSGPGQSAKSLSGGNQQKVVIAKWLYTTPRVLILDEPTRGVDVGAKKEIYSIMNELAKHGVSIIMISSELPEVIGMSSRVGVMFEGKMQTVLERSELTEERIMHYATGGESFHEK